jgi:hypothetical protein
MIALTGTFKVRKSCHETKSWSICRLPSQPVNALAGQTAIRLSRSQESRMTQTAPLLGNATRDLAQFAAGLPVW